MHLSQEIPGFGFVLETSFQTLRDWVSAVGSGTRAWAYNLVLYRQQPLGFKRMRPSNHKNTRDTKYHSPNLACLTQIWTCSAQRPPSRSHYTSQLSHEASRLGGPKVGVQKGVLQGRLWLPPAGPDWLSVITIFSRAYTCYNTHVYQALSIRGREYSMASHKFKFRFPGCIGLSRGLLFEFSVRAINFFLCSGCIGGEIGSRFSTNHGKFVKWDAHAYLGAPDYIIKKLSGI